MICYSERYFFPLSPSDGFSFVEIQVQSFLLMLTKEFLLAYLEIRMDSSYTF